MENFSPAGKNDMEPVLATDSGAPPADRRRRRDQADRREAGRIRIIRYSITATALLAIILAVIPWYSAHLQDKSLKQAEQGYQIDALHTASSAASWNPLSINALFVLAGAQQRVGYATEARATLEKAVEMQPLNYAVWKQLAVYERDYWKMPDQAHQDFIKASSLNPYDAELRQDAGLPPLKASG